MSNMPKIVSIMGLIAAIAGAIVGFFAGWLSGLVFKAFLVYWSAPSGYVIAGWGVVLAIVWLATAGILSTMRVRGITAVNWGIFSAFVGIAIFFMILVGLLQGTAVFGI